jgi:hypothetical protein
MQAAEIFKITGTPITLKYTDDMCPAALFQEARLAKWQPRSEELKESWPVREHGYHDSIRRLNGRFIQIREFHVA